MNQSEVIKLLKANQTKKTTAKRNQSGTKSAKLKRFGIGLTVLRKLAKQIGRDRSLAIKLWETDIYEARIIALLIDDPKQMTQEQAEMQVDSLGQGHLAHVFSACGATLAKTSFVVPLLLEWIKSQDTMRRSCGYGLLYEVSKSKTKSAPDDSFFLDRIDTIDKTFQNEHIDVQGSMGAALLGMGKRSASLNSAALKLAKKIGPIQMESNGKACEPFDLVKHLTSDYLREKLGV